MIVFAGYLLIFVGVGAFFLLFHLLLGKIVRPAKPSAEKLSIYECGEPTIGSSWIQFDLRFYVVALLFVIFDVEVVFFFPWAVVFGKANTLASQSVPVETRNDTARELFREHQLAKPGPAQPDDPGALVSRSVGSKLAVIAFLDIVVFFGVLLVGFAYLWKRGDLDWVRSTLAERLGPEAETS